MRLCQFLFAAMVSFASTAASSQIIASCGESSGTTFVFGNQPRHQSGSGWFDDGMSGGRITLVEGMDGWDIRFRDAMGEKTYRDDGAEVALVSRTERFIVVAALHDNYLDVYTFDLHGREVAWTSNKTGPFMVRSGLMRAPCD